MSKHTTLDPPYHCARCPRLRAFIDEQKAAHPDWFNGPVPSFGDRNARLMIVGLAPGLQGANRTGRPFTGDYAGDLLYETLAAFAFSTGTYDKHVDDGLMLKDVMITNAVRCVPPQNKPTGAEINTCRDYLTNTLAAHDNLKSILALGRIAHDTMLRTFGLRVAHYPFSHGARHDLPNGLVLFDSYHCSRYNTNTGRLTPDMFQSVFRDIVSYHNAV